MKKKEKFFFFFFFFFFFSVVEVVDVDVDVVVVVVVSLEKFPPFFGKFENALAYYSTRFRYSLADIGFSSGCGAGGDSERARGSARGDAERCDRRPLVDRRRSSSRRGGSSCTSSAAHLHSGGGAHLRQVR